MSTDILKSGDELDRLSQSMQVDLQEERKLLELPNAYRSPAITRSTGISTDDYNKVPLQDLDVSTYGMEEIDDKRAEEQSISDQWANAAVKMVGLAGTTFLDSTVGTVAGLTNALISDKPFLESFIDDPVSRKLKEFNDSMEQWMPNYYTRERQDQTFAVGTANFWADKILKNMGFTIGAVMAGMVTGGATASVLGRKTLQNQIARNLSKNSVKLASKNITPKAIKEMAEKGVIDEKLIAEELLANAKQLKNVDAATEIIASVAGSIGESRIEAINAKDELFEKYKQEGLSDEQAMEKATKAANLIFGGNMAVLSAGNYAQFRKAFSPGYNPSKLGDAYLTKTVKDGKLSYAGQKNIEKFIKRSQALFGNPAIEGNEEMMQNAIKNASEEFVSRGENLEGKETVKAYIDSFLKGMIKTYSDPHAYEEGFAGIFAGGIGSPTITGSGVGWAGGALGDLKEVNRNIAQAEEATEALNKITESERFQEGYRNAVANAKYESQKEAALKVGDQFEFKNIEHEQLINDALTFLEYGQFSDFIESIESVKNTEASELRKLVQIQPKQKLPNLLILTRISPMMRNLKLTLLIKQTELKRK
jgi:hypothetical protein